MNGGEDEPTPPEVERRQRQLAAECPAWRLTWIGFYLLFGVALAVSLSRSRLGVEPDDDFLTLNTAIKELEQTDPRKADLIKLRYFAGLHEEEAALALGASGATASRWWTFAKAWLFEQIQTE